MRAKAGAELEALEAELRYALLELKNMSSKSRATSLLEAQADWEKFRDSEATFASLSWEGGSGAPLIYLATKIELTEQRLKALALAKAEIESR